MHCGSTASPQFPGAMIKRLLAALALMGLLSAVVHSQSSCKAVIDADDKKDATPYHAYMTRTSQLHGAKSETNEAIFAGGVAYIKVKDIWKRSRYTAEQQRQQKLKNRKEAQNFSCKYLRDELMYGELAHVYAVHTETEEISTNATMWVSAARGLLIRNEQDRNLGNGGGKSHISTRFDYAHVGAPAGVR